MTFSSASVKFGYSGQARYATGNICQGALARLCTSQGWKAIAIDLLATVDAESDTVSEGVLKRLRAHGPLMFLDLKHLHSLLDIYQNPDSKCAGKDYSQLSMKPKRPRSVQARGMTLPRFLYEPVRQALWLDDGKDNSNIGEGNGGTEDKEYTVKVLKAASPLEEAAKVVASALGAKLCKALDLPQGEINTKSPMYEYGIDSLLTVEIRSWMLKWFNVEISTFDLLKGSPIFQMCGELVAKRAASVAQSSS